MAEQLAFAARRTDVPPLADRMRPARLEDYIGQSHLLGDGMPLRRAIEARRIPSCIFWGPPGTGKTTLARLLAGATDAEFVPFSAVLGGVKELREILDQARDRLHRRGKGTLLFVDEIHRFNKGQQDAFLPHVEAGLITLLGATTENPSFELNSALLSRAQVYVLQPLSGDELTAILRRALTEGEHGLKHPELRLEAGVLEAIADHADGDGRRALNVLEQLSNSWKADAKRPDFVRFGYLHQLLAKRTLRYDRASEEHYNITSAFIKSLRGSDPDASVYYLARMIEGGENPTFIARRLVIFASEDVGNADPRALQVAVAAAQAVELIGLPECQFNLAQATLYLAMAPKSNTAKTAYFAARDAVSSTGSLPVPAHILNAPTALMKELGYGAAYRYPHDYPDHFINEQYLPDAICRRKFVEPSGMGLEKSLEERLEILRRRALERGE